MREPALALNAWLRWDALQRALGAEPFSSVLELGVGRGGFGARLCHGRSYVGVEPDDASRAAARQVLGDGVRLLASDTELGGDERFDVVCAFEVLEHLPEDAAALAAWLPRCRTGGRIVVSVPADPARFGAWDRHVGHVRRYARDDLERLLVSVGLHDVVVISYGTPLGYLLEAARNLYARLIDGRERARSIEERTASSGRMLQPPRVAASMTRLISLPFRLVQRPFSRVERATGLVAVGRCPVSGV